MKFWTLIIIYCFLSTTGLFAQVVKGESSLNECSKDICIEVKHIVDSLLSKKIDTVLAYKFLPGNAYGGYAKVLWIEKGKTKQCLIDAGSEKPRLRPTTYSKSLRDSTFHFYFKNRIDTVITGPQDEELESVSHDPRHYVWVSINGVTNSFVIPYLLVYNYLSHIQSQLVSLLMKQSHLREMKRLRKQVTKQDLR